MRESLRKYQADCPAKLTALLLDCTPDYGYVVVGLKQSPVEDANERAYR